MSTGREIGFGGEGTADLFLQARKWVTVRLPDPKYDFRPGERVMANCFDDGSRLPARILDTEIKPLQEIAPALLGLDGWVRVPAKTASSLAAIEMREYGGRYSGVTRKTPMVRIAMATEGVLDVLESDTRQALVEKPFEQAILTPEVRPTILPALAFWSTVRGLAGRDWLNYLRDTALITNEDRKGVMGEMKGDWRLQVLNSASAFREVVDHGDDDPIYQKLILLR